MNVFSCVVDNKPIFMLQSYYWINALIHFGKIKPNQIYVHLVNVTDQNMLDWLTRMNVNLCKVNQFDQRQPYCNKLTQFETFRHIEFDYLFMMDCDIFVTQTISIDFQDDIYAKSVDFANPPLEMLSVIFEKALEASPELSPSSFPNAEYKTNMTDINNCNGGVYIIKKTFLNDLSSKWTYWANWCIENLDLFGDRHMHADQVSFAIAMRDLKKKVTPLDLSWNYPTHLNKNILPNISPKIIHYHREFDSRFMIKEIDIPLVDQKIQAFNAYMTNKFSQESLFRYLVKKLRSQNPNALRAFLSRIKRKCIKLVS